MRLLITVSALMLMLFSCEEKKPHYVANKTINCTIEGMTCAEGCAKAIETTIAELPGVELSRVDFEKKIALFSFDSNLVKTDAIIAQIESLNKGQYKTSLMGAELPATEKQADQEEAVEVKKETDKAHS